MIEDLRIGAAVHGNTGKQIGHLSRVVIDGPSDRVLSLVVDPGLVASGNLLAPGGWERPRERVVPVAQVASATAEIISLTLTEDDFEHLPLFEQERFITVSAAASEQGQKPGTAGAARFEAGQLLNYAASEFGLGGAPYLPPAEISHAEPPNAGAIAAGTQVWRLEPHERIGEVERVLVESESQRVSGLVLRRGLLRHQVVLPVSAITGVEDDVVHVRMSDEDLKSLAPFEPEA